jgi:hypothetical protein
VHAQAHTHRGRERDLPDEQICATYAGQHIKVYMKDKPHEFGYKLLCCAVIWALLSGLKVTVGRRMMPNFGKLRNLIWDQVAAL